MSKHRIRHAEIRDLEDVKNLFQKLHDIHNEHANILESCKDRYDMLDGTLNDLFIKMINDDRSYLYLLEINGKIKGLISYEIEIHNKIDKKCFLLDIVVSEYRKGYGTALIEFMTNEVKRQGCSEIRLNVYDFNTQARNFYKKNKFRTNIIFLEAEASLLSKNI